MPNCAEELTFLEQQPVDVLEEKEQQADLRGGCRPRSKRVARRKRLRKGENRD